MDTYSSWRPTKLFQCIFNTIPLWTIKWMSYFYWNLLCIPYDIFALRKVMEWNKISANGQNTNNCQDFVNHGKLKWFVQIILGNSFFSTRKKCNPNLKQNCSIQKDTVVNNRTWQLTTSWYIIWQQNVLITHRSKTVWQPIRK